LSNIETDKIQLLNPEKFRSFRYEDLLTNPEKELRDICRFIEIPFAESMLTYHKNMNAAIEMFQERAKTKEAKSLRIEASHTIHKNLSIPIDTTLITTWQKEFSQEEIRVLDELCGNYAMKFGYKQLYPNKKTPRLPLKMHLYRDKLRWYYRLPIWLRELKSKPNLAYIENMK
jgi:hypothetical protein